VHPRLGTPYVTTLVTGGACAMMGGVLPIGILSDLTSIGTLFAFFLVCTGVMVLRRRLPNMQRPFKLPFGPYVIPLLGAGSAAALMLAANPASLVRLFVWMAIGMAIYVFYGRRHSKLQGIKSQG
jgi:basic amino acid/polyamine antiporter, APA family